LAPLVEVPFADAPLSLLNLFDDLIHGHDTPVSPVQGGQKRTMDIACLDDSLLKLQTAGGTTILSDQTLKAQVRRGPGGGIHTHVGHHPGDDQAADPLLLKMCQQAGFPKAVGKVLLNHRFGLKWFDSGVDFDSRGVRDEKRRTLMCGDVPYMNDRHSILSKKAQDLAGRLRGFLAPFKGHLTPFEVIILDIDQH
jgi:hypothetical protein